MKYVEDFGDCEDDETFKMILSRDRMHQVKRWSQRKSQRKHNFHISVGDFLESMF